MPRIALATLVCWGMALFLARVVATGIRSGRIRYSGSAFALRAKTPLAFWLLVALFLGFIALFLAVWTMVVVQALAS